MVRTVLTGDIVAVRRTGRLELCVGTDLASPSAAASATILILRDYAGPELPSLLHDARVELDVDGAVAGRILTGAGVFAFRAGRVDAFEHVPSLFAALHAPFRLRRRDRWVAGWLLKALRLPWGARLLTAWHVRRTRDPSP